MDDTTQAPLIDEPAAAPKKPRKAAEPAPAPAPTGPLSFADVMAWNRANADKLPPTPELPKKKRPKTKAF